MRRALALFIALLTAAGFALAQEDADLGREAEIAATAERLSQFAADLADNGVDDPVSFERDIRSVIAASRARVEPVDQSLERVENSLAALGPAPKVGEAPEAGALAAERQALNKGLSLLRGHRTRILAAIEEGSRLLGDLSERRLRDTYRRVMRRGAPIVAPSLWTSAAAQADDLSNAVGGHFSRWADGKKEGGGLAWAIGGLVAALVASFLMVVPLRDWMQRAFAARIEKFEATPARRVAVAGLKMLTRLIPGIVGGLIVIETLRALGLLAPGGVAVARAVWVALIAYLVIDGFTSGLFAPSAPTWRLAPIDAAKGRRAARALLAIVFVVGVKAAFVEIVRASGGADALTHLAKGVAAIIVGAALFVLCERNLWVSAPSEAKEGGPSALWPAVRFFGRAFGVLLMAATIAGHVNLADFIASRLYYLTLLLAAVWFARAVLKEIAAWADRRLRAGKPGEAPDDDGGTFQFWVGAGVDVVLALFLAPALFVLAGVEASAVRDFFMSALVGFRIGGVVISLSDIFFAIAAFVSILVLTGMVQGALQRGPLAHSRIDTGIKNSLTTLFGYAGLVIAAIVALGILGVNLTNLALIAGALSVGIGFGLQSIVNNFVSGLILLFERPIKAGDWIVTASGEGVVKKISVRSTELETFDRAAIIIPNSELVASTVTNWTHKNALGRIRVPVGVSYASDPETVKEALLKCANDHPLVVRYPEPFVVWDHFGASSLDFELRAFISDISRGLQVRTDLRFAIFRAFKEKGIEFPFLQQDVHIKSFPDDAARPASAQRPSTTRGTAPSREPEDVADAADSDD